MTRRLRFTFLCDEKDWAAIAMLAEYLDRSKSDTVRFVIATAVKKLQQEQPIEPLDVSQNLHGQKHDSE